MAEWFNDVKLSKKAYVPDPEPLQEVEPSYGAVEGGSLCHSSVFLPSPFVLSPLLVLFLLPFPPFIAPFLSSHLLSSYYSFAPFLLSFHAPSSLESSAPVLDRRERERAVPASATNHPRGLQRGIYSLRRSPS